VTLGGWLPQARTQGSCPCTRYDHCGAPVRRSIATADFQYTPGGSHDSLKPFGAAALHAAMLGGSEYGLPNMA
jgi:hypothetical protein